LIKKVAKIALRIAALLLIVIGSNWVYEHTLYQQFLEEEGDMLRRIQKTKGQHILYFSASSNFGFNDIDTDKRRISQFIDEYFPNLSVGPVDKGAVHAGVFLPLIKQIPEDATVGTIVVAMNLRSFGPGWTNSKLETPLMKSNVMYADRPALLNRFLVSLNYYDSKSDQEREADLMAHWKNDPLPFPAPKNTVDSWCRVDKWPGGNDPRRGEADHFIKNFGFVLDSNNKRVQDFDQIVKLAQARGFHLVFNILAENMERADSLVGSDLTNLMRSNRDFLTQRYRSETVPVVDNLELLPDSLFLEEGFPTEHYLQRGRQLIARNVAVILNHNYEGQFRPPPTPIKP